MEKKRVKLLQGDNIESLKKLSDNSVDSVVTDPPYALNFMGKKWDSEVPSVEFWKEVYRILKPGGHVLSFGGTRTYHRLVVNIEDSGFEIRDQIMWLYGQGFPKNHNIGKCVDKLQGNEREVVGEYKVSSDFSKHSGSMMSVNNTDDGSNNSTTLNQTKGQSPYEGWGTAMKPSVEPICVARKPLSEKSVALNVLKWGTGGINIDGCRIDLNGDDTSRKITDNKNDINVINSNKVGSFDDKWKEGRFPANIILECICDEVIKGEKGEVKKSGYRVGGKSENSVGLNGVKNAPDNYGDKGDIHTNPMCPCYMMDEQSGVSKTKVEKKHITNKNLCGIILEKKKVDGILDGVKKEVEKYFLNAEQFMSGNKSTDLYQKDTRYTISILIKLMTELKTYNASQEQNIEDYTLNLIKTISLLMEKSIEDVKNVENINYLTTSIKLIENMLHMLVIVNVAHQTNLKNGEKQTENIITNTTENIKNGSSRFFYQAKVSKSERNMGLDVFEKQEVKTNKVTRNADKKITSKNTHPTLKPVNLMAYLCRLVTPPNGICLDPYMGSGSTGIAAQLEGFRFIGMEMDEDYFKIAEARIENFESYRKFIK